MLFYDVLTAKHTYIHAVYILMWCVNFNFFPKSLPELLTLRFSAQAVLSPTVETRIFGDIFIN